jgi:hypothetical protein
MALFVQFAERLSAGSADDLDVAMAMIACSDQGSYNEVSPVKLFDPPDFERWAGDVAAAVQRGEELQQQLSLEFAKAS